MRIHSDDVDVIAPVCMCLAKLAEHPVNSAHIIASPVVGYVSSWLKKFRKDPRAAEAIVSLLRPLSVDIEVSLRRGVIKQLDFFGYCDSSVRKMDQRCRKRRTQAT